MRGSVLILSVCVSECLCVCVWAGLWIQMLSIYKRLSHVSFHHLILCCSARENEIREFLLIEEENNNKAGNILDITTEDCKYKAFGVRRQQGKICSIKQVILGEQGSVTFLTYLKIMTNRLTNQPTDQQQAKNFISYFNILILTFWKIMTNRKQKIS